MDHLEEVDLVPDGEIAGEQVQFYFDFVLAVDFVDVDFLDLDSADVVTCAPSSGHRVGFAGEVGFDCARGRTSVIIARIPIIADFSSRNDKVTTNSLAVAPYC